MFETLSNETLTWMFWYSMFLFVVGALAMGSHRRRLEKLESYIAKLEGKEDPRAEP